MQRTNASTAIGYHAIIALTVADNDRIERNRMKLADTRRRIMELDAELNAAIATK